MVTSLEDFIIAKGKPAPLITRRRAVLASGAVFVILAEAERNDVLATMRFDMTPDDLTAIESFLFHLQQRIKDRVTNEHSRTKGIEDKRSLSDIG